MGRVAVNFESISKFEKQMKDNSMKLVDILELMKNDSVQYEEMIESKAGDLYKEVMIRELEKEKNIIMNNSEEISKRLSWITNSYRDMFEEIKESIGK